MPSALTLGELVRTAASQTLAADVAAYVAVAGLSSLVACIAVSILLSALGSKAPYEMQNSGHFRGNKDVRFLYPITVAPFASAFLLALLRFAVASPKHEDWSVSQGVNFACVVWFTTAFHGIILDYATFKISPWIVLQFWAGSLAVAVVNGAALGYFF